MAAMDVADVANAVRSLTRKRYENGETQQAASVAVSVAVGRVAGIDSPYYLTVLKLVSSLRRGLIDPVLLATEQRDDQRRDQPDWRGDHIADLARGVADVLETSEVDLADDGRVVAGLREWADVLAPPLPEQEAPRADRSG